MNNAFSKYGCNIEKSMPKMDDSSVINIECNVDKRFYLPNHSHSGRKGSQ